VTGQRDVLRGFGDSSINALMLRAAAELHACREAITAGGPEMTGDLKAFTDSLDSLGADIRNAYMIQTVMWLDPDPVPSRARAAMPAPKPERHLQVVRGAR
jgi:hypothetical protein